MKVLERFLHYVSYDTQSDENSITVPTSVRQLRLAKEIVRDLKANGIANAAMDDKGYVYASIDATPGYESLPVCCLIAHMDTSPDAPGDNVHSRIVRYEGGDIVLNEEDNVVLSPEYFPSLLDYVGQELVVTDGTTLLGADDKAGVAEIVTTIIYMAQHPVLPHGKLVCAFTPDEEVGKGADHFDLERVGADFAYTVDGGALGEVEFENFNAANATVTFRGRNIHPGEAKDKMINAALLACTFVELLPHAETPSHTEGREGFFHVNRIQGDENNARVNLLIRDHDRARFEKRKQTLRDIIAYLQTRYGAQWMKLDIRDSYYNMREVLEDHMDLVDKAQWAFRECGVEPRIIPVRGGTDGARLSFMGLPCPNLSTGGVNFHGVYEYIPVESLEKMVDVLVKLVTAQDEPIA